MTQRYNVYQEVHKGLRRDLFELTLMAGATDFTDGEKVEALRKEMHKVDDLLELHALHEDRHVEPIIRALDPELADSLHSRHQELEAAFKAVIAAAMAINPADADAADGGQDLYLRLSRFVADYLSHIADEEQTAHPLLIAHHDDAFLIDLSVKIRAEVPPPAMALFLKSMIPSMNHGERVKMFTGMKAAAPAEAYEATCGLAESVLAAEDWSRLNSQVNG